MEIVTIVQSHDGYNSVGCVGHGLWTFKAKSAEHFIEA